MRLKVKVTPNAEKNQVVEKDGIYKILTTAPAKEGKANDAAIKLLSKHLKIPKSRIKIIKGHKSKDKTVAIVWRGESI